jgi:hypothetical protein
MRQNALNRTGIQTKFAPNGIGHTKGLINGGALAMEVWNVDVRRFEF